MGVGASIVLTLFFKLVRTRIFWLAFLVAGVGLSLWIWLADHAHLANPGRSLALIAVLGAAVWTLSRQAVNGRVQEAGSALADHGAQRAGQMAAATLVYTQTDRPTASRFWHGGTSSPAD